MNHQQPQVSRSQYLAYKAKKAALDQMTTIERLEHDDKEREETEKNINKVLQQQGYSPEEFNKILDDLDQFSPTIKYIKNARYQGKQLISIRISEHRYAGKFYNIKTVEIISNNLSKKLKREGMNGKIMTSLLYGELGWKSGYMSDIGEKVALYDPNTKYNLAVPYDIPKNIQAFNIYILLGKKAEGGNDDKFNDCLYDCLKYFVFDIETYFKSGCELKTCLKLNRSDKIPISMLGEIEKKLENKYQINVRGDFIRSSTIKSKKQINLILIDEHYTPEKNIRKFIPPSRYEEKKIIMLDKRTFEAYDGEKKYFMPKTEYNSIKYNFHSPYLIMVRDKQGFKDDDGNKLNLSLEEEYDLTIKISDALKKESKGLINMYKTGSYHDTALILFDRVTKHIRSEEILQDEAVWIRESSFSALIWCEKYEGVIYKYDIKSMYPNFMISTTLKFPIKRGEFQQIKSFPEYPQFGIYRCVINKSNDKNINKLFKFNYHNKYTSIDITNARNLGLEINLIQDNQPNFLYYSRDKTISFFEGFNQYVNILFPLKDKEGNTEEVKIVKLASKRILNILWGALCEVDKRKILIVDNFSINDDEEIIGIRPCIDGNGDENHLMQTVKINSYYKTSFARLCPFIIAQGRKQLSELMEPHKEYIKQIQTDGFTTTKLIHSNKDVLIGKLKFEGKNENGKIEHCNSKNKVEY